MSVFRIRFVGPATLAVPVATTLADAVGVELISSDPPSMLDDNRVGLDVAVEGALDDVAAAVANIDAGLPKGASIEIAAD